MQSLRLCACGCRQFTQLNRKGIPNRFVNTHQSTSSWIEWGEEDRGHDTPCWIWKRSMHPSGYGQGTRNNRPGLAHRIIYERLRKPIPKGFVLDHLCKVKACVNPDHLEVVSQAKNVQRGRNAKITIEDARTMRALRAAGASAPELMERYGVSKGLVYAVLANRTWAEELAA